MTEQVGTYVRSLLDLLWRRKRDRMPVTTGMHGPLVGAIDEGTSSARFIVFAARTAEVLVSHQVAVKSHYPQEGWVEQDPLAMVEAVRECMAGAVSELVQQGVTISDIVAVGVTNQRETTVVWDRLTGQPLHNAIVWLDARTTATVDQLLDELPNRNKGHLKPLCGLPLSPYFSALKIRWLLDNVPEVQLAVQEGRALFGTVDSWLIWNLTGGVDGGIHVTDVTNASRTMLMNIETLKWDPKLCHFFNVPMDLLPEIRSSSEIYGSIVDGPLQGTVLSGCLGDQQAALVGQMCFKQGQAKCTYGTGCFLLYNTGTTRVMSTHGLLTTVAYRLGRSSSPVYALEGSVAVAGAALGWLKDSMGILADVSTAESLARVADSAGEVCFVPAFSGLYAPYWQQDARGVICGVTEDTTKAHIVRAALEAVCFQARDVLEAMNRDCGIPLTSLQVDGGMTANNLLMQLQADLVGISVMRPLMAETTALGAAMAAGVAEGVEVWDMDKVQAVLCDSFHPSISEGERDVRYSKWKKAVERSFGWETATPYLTST